MILETLRQGKTHPVTSRGMKIEIGNPEPE